MAPILSFTADELWRYLPGTREESVHLAALPVAAELEALADAMLVALDAADRPARARARRDRAAAQGQTDRQLAAGEGRGLDHRTRWGFSATPGDLPMLFIVSEVELRRRAGATATQVA